MPTDHLGRNTFPTAKPSRDDGRSRHVPYSYDGGAGYLSRGEYQKKLDRNPNAYWDEGRNALMMSHSGDPFMGAGTSSGGASIASGGSDYFRRENVKGMFDWYKNRYEENRELATEAWDRYKEGVDRANEETREDRDDILARLDTYEEGYNEDWMNSVLAQEKAQWEAKRQQTLDRVQQQYANMGRQASPYLLGEINRRMTAQEADALQARRFELEQERDSRRQWALQIRNQIYSDTQRQVMNPQAATQLMTSLGKGASTVIPQMANAM